MPANLTPQYKRAEEDYRRAQSPDEQLRCLEEMLRLMPKHKGTDHLQADLKRRIKETREEATAKKSAKPAKSFRFPRQGAGQVIVLGAPNAGKSRTLAELTSAKPEVAAYPFTTREPSAGMMPWEDVALQLIDTPPVSGDHFEPYLVGLARAADAVLLCMDGSSDDAPEETLAVLGQFRDRKTVLGSHTGFDEEDYGTVHVKTLLIVTRGSDSDLDARLEIYTELGGPDLPREVVEFDRPDDVARLRDRIYQFLDVIRVYTKAPGKKAEYVDPFTVASGATVEDLAGRIHRDLAEKLKFAKLWNSDSDGRTVGPDHVLSDRDMVEIHT